MYNLKTFENFLNELKFDSIKSDRNTNLFLEGVISEKQWKEQFFNNLNENWFEDIKKWFVDKILSSLKSIYEKVLDNIAIGYLKVKSIIDSVVQGIEKFKKNHPIIWWIVIITIVISVVIFLLILTAQQAKAGETPEKSALQWNYAIGLIDNLITKSDDMSFDKLNLLMHTKAYCMDMRDGLLGKNGIDWNAENLDKIKGVVDIAIKSFNEVKQTASAGNKGDQRFIMEMIDKGSQFVSYIHQHSIGLEKITFSLK